MSESNALSLGAAEPAVLPSEAPRASPEQVAKQNLARLTPIPDRPWWQLALGAAAALAVGTVVYQLLSPSKKAELKTLGELARDLAEPVVERSGAYHGLGHLLDDVAPLAPPRLLNPGKKARAKCRPELPENLPEDAEVVDAVVEAVEVSA